MINISNILIQGDIPAAIDDHSLVQLDVKQLVVFGGFAGGSRVNSIYSGQLGAPNIFTWSQFSASDSMSKNIPAVRNSHSTVGFGTSIFIFGGQDEDTNKLKDLWEFNTTTKQWSKIAYQSTSSTELARSGHAAVSFGSKMFIFGGIFEVTKELNDLIVYDFKTQKISVLDHNGSSSDNINSNSQLDESVSKINHNETGGSTMKRGKTVTSPSRKVGQSPSRKSALGGAHGSPASSPHRSPTKKGGNMGTTISGANGPSGEEKGLSSPTSISMQNSFIIKNADESFDLYFQQMKRRKHVANFTAGGDQTIGSSGGYAEVKSSTSFQRNKKPNARDGHTANVDKFGFMYIFGGDRHQMPFNDLYLIKLPK